MSRGYKGKVEEATRELYTASSTVRAQRAQIENLQVAQKTFASKVSEVVLSQARRLSASNLILETGYNDAASVATLSIGEQLDWLDAYLRSTDTFTPSSGSVDALYKAAMESKSAREGLNVAAADPRDVERAMEPLRTHRGASSIQRQGTIRRPSDPGQNSLRPAAHTRSPSEPPMPAQLRTFEDIVPDQLVKDKKRSGWKDIKEVFSSDLKPSPLKHVEAVSPIEHPTASSANMI
jgi:hypothetical protein